MYSHDVVNVVNVVDDNDDDDDDDVVVVVVVVVVDDLELLQRWSPAGQLNLELLNISGCLN